MLNNNLDSFQKYLLAEYQNIAEAHFRTIAAISSFFQYYITIMALPIALMSVLASLSIKEEFLRVVSFLVPLLSIVSLVIAIIGFFVLAYIINLRMDAILYARTVNAIRRYFYNSVDIDITTKLKTRVLPLDPSLPSSQLFWAYVRA